MSKENIEIKWYYKKFSNSQDLQIIWECYEDSEFIENAYGDYLDFLQSGKADNTNLEALDELRIYELPSIPYKIDFLNNIQISIDDPSRQ